MKGVLVTDAAIRTSNFLSTRFKVYLCSIAYKIYFSVDDLKVMCSTNTFNQTD